MSGDRYHAFTLSFGSESRFRAGEYVEMMGTTLRVVGTVGRVVTVRELRWYERAWLRARAELIARGWL